MAEAMEGIDLNHMVEMLERAAELWADVGYEKATSLCTELARSYTQRLRGEGDEGHDGDVEETKDELGTWDLDNLWSAATRAASSRRASTTSRSAASASRS